MSRGSKIAIIAGGVVLAILVIISFIWGGFSGWRGGWGMMGPGMMGGFGWGLMPLLVIIFWGLVIWGIVAAVRYSGHHTGCCISTTEPALELLKRRYALGEITKKEYEEKKKDLS